MFFTFLNKENPDYLDSSVLFNALPRQVLYYYYQGSIRISLEVYQTLRQVAGDDSALSDTARVWVNLIEEQLEAGSDLEALTNIPYLESLGPYYYPDTNTRFYFTKDAPQPDRLLTFFDLSVLMSLDKSIPVNRDLQQFAKARKAKKNSPAELVKELNYCVLALQEIEQLNRQINYLRKLLDHRYRVIEEEELFPAEPDEIPEKPLRESEERMLDNIIPFARVRSLRKKQEPDGSRFNHDVKVYFIRYREYEKACDRYKQVLENWSLYQQAYLDRCYNDIDDLEAKLKRAHQHLEVYSTILSKSTVHPDYQDVKTLDVFRYFLETGRTGDIQECMNLYEEERHWNEIKASQERIENTIYFLQTSSEQGLLANEQLDLLLRRQQDKSGLLPTEPAQVSGTD